MIEVLPDGWIGFVQSGKSNHFRAAIPAKFIDAARQLRILATGSFKLIECPA